MSSLILQGWGTPANLLRQGYGATVAGVVLSPAPLLRETFVVPWPAGSVAHRRGAVGLGQGAPPYVGSGEQDIAFGLDFGLWLGPAEALAGAPLPTATVMADPFSPSVAPYDASGSFVAATAVDGSKAIVSVQTAMARTRYLVTLLVTTTAGRVLECQMPPIDCPQ